MGLFEEKCEKLKVIVSEIDGIITEHLSPIDEMGNVLFKQYYMKDFEAVYELKKTFIFVFLTADNAINYNLARKKNIPLFWSKTKNKRMELNKILQKYGASPEEIMYIGCSFSDLESIEFIPFSVCPADAISDVQIKSYITLSTVGGCGVLCEVYELLNSEIIRRKRLDK